MSTLDLGLLARELGKVRAEVVQTSPNARPVGRPKLPPPGPSRPFLLVFSAAQIAGLAARLSTFTGPISLGIKAAGGEGCGAPSPFRDELRLLIIAIPGTEPWLIPLGAVGCDLGPLAGVLAEAKIVAHDAKLVALFLRVKCGLALKRLFCCTTAAVLLTNGAQVEGDPGVCLVDDLGDGGAMEPAECVRGATTFSPDGLVADARDVEILHARKAELEIKLANTGLIQAAGIEMALIPVVVDMEFAGMPFDRKLAEATLRELEAERSRLDEDLKSKAGLGFNPGSTGDVKQALQARGFAVASTAKGFLSSMNDSLAADVVAFRGVDYPAQQLRAYLNAVTDENRIHASFNQLGAETGRFSCCNPNLQGVPHTLRRYFAAPEGYVLIDADFSQVELRIIALLANDEVMLEAFRRGDDLHEKTAREVMGFTGSEVRWVRQQGKAVNFGMVFYQSAQGLVTYAREVYQVEITLEQAQIFREKFLEVYHGIRRWHQRARSLANGPLNEVRTVTGRRRLLPSGLPWWDRFTGFVNTPVQGGAADGLKLAMINLQARLPARASLVLTLHDELIVLAPEALAAQVKEIVEKSMREAMEGLFPGVPFEIKAQILKNWGEKT